jgi:hypothetical protein
LSRLLIGAAFGLVVGVVAGAAAQTHAADASGMGAGAQTGVDGSGQDGGSVNAVPDLTAAPAPSSVWDRLANCESGGDWHAATGNGYYGGLQEDLVFWRRHGGPRYASRPDLASRAAQIAVAEQGLSIQGWSAWPACSRRLGLR